MRRSKQSGGLAQPLTPKIHNRLWPRLQSMHQQWSCMCVVLRGKKVATQVVRLHRRNRFEGPTK